MKVLIFLLFVCFAAIEGETQTVGIGTTTPNSNAILDVSSATKPMIVPRLNSTAIANIPAPVDGMLVFNTDVKAFWGYSSGGISAAVAQTTANGTVTSYNGTDVGQSFTAPRDMLLQSISVTVSSFSGTLASFQLRLRAGEGYSGAIIGSAAFNVSSANTFEIDLSAANIELKSSQVYTIEIDQLTGSGNTNFSIANSNTYTGGQLYSGAAAVAGSDLYFTIKQKVAAGWKSLSE